MTCSNFGQAHVRKSTDRGATWTTITGSGATAFGLFDDAAAADKTFDMLMGNEVAPRKRFIQSHAKKVRNLDV